MLRSRLQLTEVGELVPRLALVKDSAELDRLLDVASLCRTLDDFRAALS